MWMVAIVPPNWLKMHSHQGSMRLSWRCRFEASDNIINESMNVNYTRLYLLCIIYTFDIIWVAIMIIYSFYISQFLYDLHIQFPCWLFQAARRMFVSPMAWIFARPLPRAEGKRCGATLSSLGEELSRLAPPSACQWWWGFNIFQTGFKDPMVHGKLPYNHILWI